jgi:hypothetical protein
VADLFTLEQLASYMQESLAASTATVARRVAYGWLSDATGLTTWPDPVPDTLFSWAIELAAIAHRNPDGALSEQTDDHRVQWDRQRRADILEVAKSAYPSPGPATAGPQYSFPTPDWSWGPVATTTQQEA